MKLRFSKQIVLRQPFCVQHLPLTARLYAKGYGEPQNRFHKFIIKPICKRLFNVFIKLPFDLKGQFIYKGKEKDAVVSFRTKNTQFHSIYLPEYKYFEPETLALVDVLLTGNDVFYDVGSNWGHYTLHALSNKKYKGNVYAFEPMKETFADLKEVIQQAGLDKEAHVNNFALSDREGDGTMHIPDGIHSGNAMLSDKNTGEKISLKKMDALNLPQPTLMKVDAEGHEAEIFTGGEKTISTHHPYVVFENSKNISNPDKMFEPILILKKLGYAFFIPLFSDRNAFQNKQGIIPVTAPQATLSLIEFEPEERYFLDEQINIFACHTDKLKELENKLCS